MAARVRRNGKPKAVQANETRLESNQRMVWIEQGGIDLREAREKARASPRKTRKG
jgi:hypothetical protein